MRLYKILLVLVYCTLFAVGASGFLYYYHVKSSLLTKEKSIVANHGNKIQDLVSFYLTDKKSIIRTLAGLKEIKNALITPDNITLTAANHLLDHFNDALEMNVAYLMDQKGNTIASSNRHDASSFMGKNYSFRPYFQQAIDGEPAVYVAQGVTSGTRGIYYSHPVYGDTREGPVGVVVIKDSVDKIEKAFAGIDHDDVKAFSFITGMHDVIFMSGHKDFIYKSLWNISDEKRGEVFNSKQFGKGPWEWSGFKRTTEGRVVDQSANAYLMFQTPIDMMPGWKVIHLHGIKSFSGSIVSPLNRIMGLVVLILSIMLLLFVTALFKMRRSEIVRRLKAEDELSRSEEKYRLLAENAADVIWIRDMNLNTTYTSPSVEKLLGYTVQESMDIPILERATPASAEKMNRALMEELRLEEKGSADPSRSRHLELEQIRKDGSTIWVEANMNFIRDEHGTAVGILGITRDITRRKQAEQKIQEQESKFRNLFELSPQAIALTEIKSGKLIDINHTFCKLTQYTQAELIGKTTTEAGFYSDEDRRIFIKELQTSGEVNELEMKFRVKDGSTLTALMFARAITASEKPFLLTTFLDITIQKQLEDQLRQAQKMETIGNLAGGIAHDFNNLLSSVIGFTELALEDAVDGTAMEDNLREIYTAGIRAKELVKQILTFARQTDEEISVVPVKSVAEESLNLLRASLPRNIDIKKRLEGDCFIMSNETQVQQIFMNLCTNAAQAMEETGGILDVSLSNVHIDAQSAGIQNALTPGPYVKITVSDNGPGISPDAMDFIFDPYFTTKDVGKGSGMGLAIVHGIVKIYEGDISAESTMGKGTVFTVYLPSVKRDGERKPAETTQLPMGTERILFIDDEAPIAKMGKRILEGLGYKVTVRTSSVEALELFRAKPDAFDLVITDTMMPNMTGDELAVELMGIRSDIGIILCTGYSKKISEENATIIGIKAFAYKPMVKADLARTVRNVLDDVKGTTHK